MVRAALWLVVWCAGFFVLGFATGCASQMQGPCTQELTLRTSCEAGGAIERGTK